MQRRGERVCGREREREEREPTIAIVADEAAKKKIIRLIRESGKP